MPITLDGSSLTIETLVAVARDNEEVQLAPEALDLLRADKNILFGKNRNGTMLAKR